MLGSSIDSETGISTAVSRLHKAHVGWAALEEGIKAKKNGNCNNAVTKEPRKYSQIDVTHVQKELGEIFNWLEFQEKCIKWVRKLRRLWRTIRLKSETYYKDKILEESKENVQITKRKEAETHGGLRSDHTELEYLMPMATTEEKPGQRPISIPTTRTCSLKWAGLVGMRFSRAVGACLTFGSLKISP